MRHSPGTIALSVRVDPYNIITEFYVIDMESPHNAILKWLWLHMMKVVPSTYRQLVRYLTVIGTANIRGDHAISRTISAIARKKSDWRLKIVKTASDENLPARKKQK